MIKPELKDVISSSEDDNLQEIATVAGDEEAEAIKKKSIRGVLSYAVRTFANQGIALLATLALTAFLTTEEFGVYYIVTAVLGLFTFLSDIGLASALIQKKEEPTVAELRTTFTVQQILSVIILLVVVALTPYWRNTQNFGNQELWLLYVIAASFFVITFKTIPSVLLFRKLRFDLVALPAVVENVVFYTTCSILAWQGFGVLSFLWAVIARDLCGVAIMYILQGWPIGLGISVPALKGLMKVGFKFQLNDLLARIKDDLFNIVVIGAWLDLSALGYIGWAKRFSNIPQQFTVNNITAITFPTYSRLQADKNLLRKAIEKTTYFVTLVAFPLLAGVCIFMIPLVNIVPEYHKWRPALLALTLFSVNIAWSTISTPLTNTLNAIGHLNKTLILMVMWLVLTWTVTPIGIYFFGFNGVALASALIGCTSLVTVWMVKQVVPFSLWPNIWRQIVATLVMIAIGVAGLSFWSRSFVHMAMGIVLTGSVFAIVYLVIGWNSLKKELNSLGLWPKKLPRFLS